MYGHYGLPLNIENIYSLVAPFVLPDENIKTMKDLKPAYIRFLQSVHPTFPIQNGEVVVSDRNRIQSFGEAFSASVIDDLQQERMVGSAYNEELFQANAKLLRQSIKELHKLNPELGELFDLAVHAIMLCDSDRNKEGFRAHGGTSSKCIGLIWLNIHPELSMQNVLEMLIHELTHTLVFLDELNCEHFNYDTLSKEPYWALSSILKRRRPMDKVIHSVVVSMEILFARRHYLPAADETQLIHPESKVLAANIAASIDSVLTHPLLQDVCKERTIELMRNAKVQLNQNYVSKGAQNAIAL